MGAETFETKAKGKTAQRAFDAAQKEARYMHGHCGYTGTIAEKPGFVVIPVPDGEDPHDFVERLLDESDPRIDDKWGPAGCVAVGKDEWLFFGWASS